MKHAKRGLRLLSFSIIVNIAWAVASVLLASYGDTSSGEGIINWLLTGVHLLLISALVSILCYFIDLIGLHIAGKDSKDFKRASRLKIITIVLTIVTVILSAIYAAKELSFETLSRVALILSFLKLFSSVSEIVVLASIIKGCRVIAPRVTRLSKFVFACFVLLNVASIVINFMGPYMEGDEALTKVAMGISVVCSVVAVLYLVCYILLILRTTVNVGKPKKGKAA